MPFSIGDSPFPAHKLPHLLNLGLMISLHVLHALRASEFCLNPKIDKSRPENLESLTADSEGGRQAQAGVSKTSILDSALLS